MNDSPKTEQQKQEEAIYKLGYNNADIISQFMPEFMNALISLDTHSSLLKGLRAGKQEFDRRQQDQEKSYAPAWLKRDLTKEFNPRSAIIDEDRKLDKEQESDR